MLAFALSLLATASSPTLPSLLSDVLVVDSTGGGDYQFIQDAVNAAANGDIVLVRAGSYAGFNVNGLGLTIIGDNVQPRPQITSRVLVRSLLDDQTLVLSGFDIQGGGVTFQSGTALEITDCVGAVRIQDSRLTGRNGTAANPFPQNGVNIYNSDDVALTSLTIQGGSAYSPTNFGFGAYAERGAYGVLVYSSRVVVQRCTVAGGDGGSWTQDGNAGDGGTGLITDFQVELVLVHVLVTGGDGGDSGDGIGPFCAVGGDALNIHPTQNDARAQALTLVPGEGGTHVFFGNTCSSGDQLVGALTLWNGNPRAMTTAPLARAGEPVSTVAYGQPGDQVWRWISRFTDWERRPAWRGVLLAQRSSPNLVQLLGYVPGDGSLEIDDSWQLPSGLEGTTLHVQALFRATTGKRTLSNTTAITVLDPAF